MMFRGTVHLLLYRLIYHEVLIPADEVHDAASLAVYLVCNYLLYLRVSGQFHMACGMLHLFGFELPETHHHYLLATGFTDYWRRINIYWKDFMVRIVFNPVVFRLKRRPQPVALAVGDAGGLPGHLVAARLPVVLAPGDLGLQRPRRPLLGHPRGPGAGQRPARREEPAGEEPQGGLVVLPPLRDPGRQDGGHLHDDRGALVALVEPERRRLGGPDATRTPVLNPMIPRFPG